MVSETYYEAFSGLCSDDLENIRDDVLSAIDFLAIGERYSCEASVMDLLNLADDMIEHIKKLEADR